MSIATRIDQVFERLTAGELTPTGPSVQSGWTMALPTGQEVPRSVLQREATPLIELGHNAVPMLLERLDSANLALRYVAIHALEEITGISADMSYFDIEDADGRLAQAKANWRAWYESRVNIQ